MRTSPWATVRKVNFQVAEEMPNVAPALPGWALEGVASGRRSVA